MDLIQFVVNGIAENGVEVTPDQLRKFITEGVAEVRAEAAKLGVTLPADDMEAAHEARRLGLFDEGRA